MYEIELPLITIYEDSFPDLYPCPLCKSPLHFADGFVFCTRCNFAREERTVTIVRQFECTPDPYTSQLNPTPIYFCEASSSSHKKHAVFQRDEICTYHPSSIYTFVKEYRFCGGTHATYKIYPFRKYDPSTPPHKKSKSKKKKK